MVDPAIQQLINEQLFGKIELAYICVDQRLRIKSVSDNLERYGYGSLTLGEDIRDSVDFMVGLDSTTQIDLPLVASPSGIPVSVSLLPADDILTVLITDASIIAEQRQQLQQQANENELLLYKQKILMSQLEEASDELAQKNHQLEEASRLQTSFLSGVSHEFRTPLTSIIGYTNLVKQAFESRPSAGGAMPEDNLDYLRAVQRSSKHLLSLVENLLDHGKLDSDEIVIRPKPADLQEVFDDVELLLKPLCTTKNIEFEVDARINEHVLAIIDDSRIRQCLINLVGNAIKFTDEGVVKLSAEWSDDRLSVMVKDTGPGISAEDLQKIRLPFWQGADTGKAGTGLGLTITERLIEMMGGELKIESELGQGTTIQFNLPVAGVDQSAMDSRSAEQPHSNLNILLAEDDSDIADLVIMMLMEQGMQVQHVENGALALDALDDGNFDLVLMDIHMPVMTGYQALEALQQSGNKTPVVVMSASAVDADRERAEKLGCYAYLIKPVDIDDILAVARDVTGPQQ